MIAETSASSAGDRMYDRMYAYVCVENSSTVLYYQNCAHDTVHTENNIPAITVHNHWYRLENMAQNTFDYHSSHPADKWHISNTVYWREMGN